MVWLKIRSLLNLSRTSDGVSTFRKLIRLHVRRWRRWWRRTVRRRYIPLTNPPATTTTASLVHQEFTACIARPIVAVVKQILKCVHCTTPELHFACFRRYSCERRAWQLQSTRECSPCTHLNTLFTCYMHFLLRFSLFYHNVRQFLMVKI